MSRFSLRRIKDDEQGSFLIIWGIAFAVFLGIVALSFDLGRVGVTHTDLQSYADSVALAAAGELDGSPDAILDAEEAAATFVDTQLFSTSRDRSLTDADYQLTFLSDLPDSDLTSTAAFETTSDAEARFVRVDIVAHDVNFLFGGVLRAFTGGDPNETATVSAYAIAGITTIACDISTMMMCIPEGFDPNAASGDVVLLRSGGGGAGQWGPGNYGFLAPPDGASIIDPEGACGGFSRGQQEWCALAAARPATTCFEANGVDTTPGQQVGRMAAALNTRFGIYEGVLNSYRSHPDFGPAPNIISGRETFTRGGGGNPQCRVDFASPDDPEYTVGLPPDDCFATNSCPGGRFGNGNFAAGYANYVNTNYGTAPGWFPPYPTTRYQIYLSEIANSVGGNILVDRQETGAPVCNAANASTDPERRVIIIAGIDCGEHDVRGRSRDVPVAEWVRGFILNPAESSNKDVYVEILGSAEAGNGGSGQIRDVVRLYH